MTVRGVETPPLDGIRPEAGDYTYEAMRRAWVVIRDLAQSLANLEYKVSQLQTTDFALEVGLGNVTGYMKVNKFGETLDADSGVPTDVWDGADGATSTDTWVAPTQARTHTITSTSVEDDESDSGDGLRTLRIYGLKTWDSKETSEDIDMDGGGGGGGNAVQTANTYVIIHRMKGLTFGATGSNEGIITATANTDATITAAIQVGEGQTLMVIYGIPSTQTIHVAKVEAHVSGVATATGLGRLLVKENVDLATAAWITKSKFRFTEVDHHERTYFPYKSFSGPCIVKIQVTTGTNDADCIAEFDAYVVDN